jgi:GxxExxY protein
MITDENDIAHQVIGMAIEVHKTIGPGLPKDIYLQCLAFDLSENGIKMNTDKILPIQYKGLNMDSGYSVDLLVEDRLIVSIETTESVSDSHIQKCLRMLRLGNYKLGLVINFNSSLLKNGIRRVTNNRNNLEEERNLENGISSYQ